MSSFGKQSIESLKGVHPDLVKVMAKAILTTPIDFTITDGVRTLAMQKTLYAKGRTTAGGIVTKADGVKNKSNHQVKADGYCYAIDLYPYVNGKIDFNDKENRLAIISAHILATANCLGVKVVWGGNFKSILDRPHFELKK